MTALTMTEGRRLLLALDAGRCCPDDVVLAVELAAIIGAELEGLFVEDADLMNLAQLPFAREVGGRSGQNRPIVRSSMESLVKRRVERAAGELERAAKLRNVPVSHTTTRGRFVHQALAQSERRNVLLLHPRLAVPTPVRQGPPRPIMVWFEDAAANGAALDIAVELARMMSAELLVGFPAGRANVEREVASALARELAGLPGRVRMHPVPGAPAEALIGAARAARVAQLVLTAGGDLATEATLERMLTALESRLVLVR